MNRRTYHGPAIISLTLALAASAWGGCSAAQDTHETDQAAASSSSGSSSSSGAGQGGASASSGDTGAGGDIISFDAGSDSGNGLDDAGTCTSTSSAASQIPLDMIVLIDKSGSMSGQKWMGTTAALTTFFNDPASAGISAGLIYFPNNKADDCNPTDYSLLDVPIGPLPANGPTLVASMPADADGGDTPTWGALKGALAAATAYQDANPTHKVILVFATDGDPTACQETSIPVIADLAKSARNYNGVQTYVIGVQGSTISNLDAIAAAGGTNKAFDITMDVTQFAAKMAEIRLQALGCEFVIPTPPNNMQLDPDKVNVSYTPKGVGKPKILPQADNLADCNGKPGWYYDNNLHPSKVILCPASCTTVQADPKALVSVLFGCKTMIN